MEEQEDEIKKLNETILNAKCHAIRDAQLIEKSEIKQETLEEDKRYVCLSKKRPFIIIRIIRMLVKER